MSTSVYTKDKDWFGGFEKEYRNTNITSYIEMPPKVLNFGSLGKRIKGFEKKQDDFGDDSDEFDMDMIEDEAEDIDIAMPEADSSDEESGDQNEDFNDEGDSQSQEVYDEKDAGELKSQEKKDCGDDEGEDKPKVGSQTMDVCYLFVYIYGVCNQ